MFNKKEHGNLTIEDIMLILLHNSDTFEEFHKKSGHDVETARTFWMINK